MREQDINAEQAAVDAGQRTCAVEGCPLRALSVCSMRDVGPWTLAVPLCWYHSGDEEAWRGIVDVWYVRRVGLLRLTTTSSGYGRACAYQRDVRRALAERNEDPTLIQVEEAP